MSHEIWGMTGAGMAALVLGLPLVVRRVQAAAGAGKVLVLGPVFEAVALAMFAAEHFTAAKDLAGVVPKWLPEPIFWTYFFGVALALAAVSLVWWRGVRWAAAGLVLFFWMIVLVVDLPELPKGPHTRFFWILTVRETCFGAGALVLAAALWGRRVTVLAGRWIVAGVTVFYAVEQMMYPRNVPGVPLEKMTPEWIPGAVVIAWAVGLVLLVCGIAMFVERFARTAAAVAGAVLVVLVALFYVPIAATEMHTPLAVEGLNYVGDTLLFGATVLLAGWGGLLQDLRMQGSAEVRV